MFYLKKKVNGDVELKIDLYDDEIYTICPKCGKELQVGNETLAGVLKDCDLASTSLYCEECSKNINKNAEVTQKS